MGIVLRAVPRAKVTLGVAGYGYAWRPHSNYQLSDARARALVTADRATSRFDAAVGEWTATLSDGSTLWWSDARSYQLRATLARELRLRGLAVWSLGLSDPIAAAARETRCAPGASAAPGSVAVAPLPLATPAWRFGMPALRAGAGRVVEDEVAGGALAASQACQIDLGQL